jgi:hypothetical protein
VVAVLLRPANVICLLPVALALGFSARRLVLCAAGILPGAILAAWYNLRVYGNPLRTGHGEVGYLFSLAWFRPTAASYLHWLPAFFSPLIFLALLGPWARPLARPARLPLSACVLVFFGFYAVYSYTHETWWFLRFVLPAFPCLVILAVAAAEGLLSRCSAGSEIRRTTLAALLLALFACNVAWQFSRLPILYSGRGNQVYRDAAVWAERSLPKDAVVLSFQASGAVFYYTQHPLIRAESLTESETFSAVRRLGALGRPVYALVFPNELMLPFSRLPGRWENVAAISQAEVWKMASPTR